MYIVKVSVKCILAGIERVVSMIDSPFGVITAFKDNKQIFRSPDGTNLFGGGDTILVYNGSQQAYKIASITNGILTAFSGGGIYLSKDGNNLGGGGDTHRVYFGGGRVEAMISYKTGAITAFYGATNGNPWGIYRSPDGYNIGGGGGTARVYNGDARVDWMMTYHGGVFTAFYNPNSKNGWGVYFSPDGNNLGGGGNTIKVYNGTARISAMIPFQDGVVTAFYNANSNKGWGVYFSTDGRNLTAQRLYSGIGIVDAMIHYKNGIVTSFRREDPWSIYYSPDGKNIGGGGNTARVYNGGARVDSMISYRGGVLTAFSGADSNKGWGVYYSHDGYNLGGGGHTNRVVSVRRPLEGMFDTDSEIKEAIDLANRVLRRLDNRWELSLAEIIDVPGISQWFNIKSDEKEKLEKAAKQNKSLYKWRDDHLNIYLSNGTWGGISSFPKDEIIVISQSILGGGIGWLHEIGHYLDLRHTHESDDKVIDTRTDSNPDDAMDSAKKLIQAKHKENMYKKAKKENWSEKEISSILYNVMSYHYEESSAERLADLTIMQLNRAYDCLKSKRKNVLLNYRRRR